MSEFMHIWIGLFVLLVLVCLIASYFRNPFTYPIIDYEIDITGRKKPSYQELIDEWIINQYGHRKDILGVFNTAIRQWDKNCKFYLSNTLLWRSRREDMYHAMRAKVIAEDYQMFRFTFYRVHTRYRQVNYQKIPYSVKDTDNILSFSLKQLLGVDYNLEEIGYETTRRKFDIKNQRSLLLPSLRKRIMERDCYTCQNCGKYMPDGNGIHIDHIVPVSKGGKTVESNLQVLCARCNLRKGCK